MSSLTFNTWLPSTSNGNFWPDTVFAGTAQISGYEQEVSIGTDPNRVVRPWDETDLDYKIGRDRYSYAEEENMIKVDKGSPAKARYAIFYAVNKDPVIFCRTKRDMIKEVKKLLKRGDVDYKSIRIFQLVGGARVVKKRK